MKKVYLLGYLANNMGDDLFFTLLCKRYPNVQFYVTSNCRLNPMPSNLNLIRITFFNRLYNRIIHFFNHDTSTTYITKELKKKYNCFISVIGSGYMQRNENDFPCNQIFENLFYKQGSYVIGCNFGPYYSNEYLEHYKALFNELSGISFRDKHSIELFGDLSKSLVAPDIVFSLDKHEYICSKKKNTVMISIMDLNYLEYSNRCEYASVYIKLMTETIKELLLKDFNVTILGMCEKENDSVIAQEIANELSDDRIRVLSYPHDCINSIISEIACSEYLISTRFHSFVLGVLFGCKVLPISYNFKIANTINDIGFTGEYIELSDLESLSGKNILEKLMNVNEFVLDEDIVERSSFHFKLLDDILN